MTRVDVVCVLWRETRRISRRCEKLAMANFGSRVGGHSFRVGDCHCRRKGGSDQARIGTNPVMDEKDYCSRKKSLAVSHEASKQGVSTIDLEGDPRR